jgi:hypothetical protein
MYSALTPENEAGTSEIKNYRFAQGLPEDQRAQFLGGANKGNTPSAIQEFEYLKDLELKGDEAGIARFFEVKRANQWRDLGGYQAPVLPGNVLGPAVPKTQSPDAAVTAGQRERQLDYETPPPNRRPPAGVTVTAPNGKTYSFPDAAAAAAFRRSIGGAK